MGCKHEYRPSLRGGYMCQLCEKDIDSETYDELTALRSQLSTAYTAGAEAMREAAKAVAFQAVDGLVDMADGSDTQTVYSALCTLPVPERET